MLLSAPLDFELSNGSQHTSLVNIEYHPVGFWGILGFLLKLWFKDVESIMSGKISSHFQIH